MGGEGVGWRYGGGGGGVGVRNPNTTNEHTFSDGFQKYTIQYSTNEEDCS